MVREDYYGNRSIIAHIAKGELFGETFACARIISLPVSVIAVLDGEIMLIDCVRIISACEKACEFHNKTGIEFAASKCLEESTAKSKTRGNVKAHYKREANGIPIDTSKDMWL